MLLFSSSIRKGRLCREAWFVNTGQSLLSRSGVSLRACLYKYLSDATGLWHSSVACSSEGTVCCGT